MTVKMPFDHLETARRELEEGRLTAATAHALQAFELMFRLLFHVKIDEATSQRFERRYKRIPDAHRPPRDLVRHLMNLRDIALSNERELVAHEVAELIAGMDEIIEAGDNAARDAGIDVG
jgi:HEPN domain-containing protein